MGVAFVLGLSSTLHCWGMCGGIIGALSMGLPGEVLRAPRRRVFLITGYNLGRIASYSLAGILSGAAGQTLLTLAQSQWAYRALQILGGAILVLIGMHLAGRLPRLQAIEGAGWRIWQWMQPLGRRFLPVNSFIRSVLAGAVWGWLPCGLVYSMLLWTAAGADPILGGASMLAFGLGTLPGMIGAGLASGGMRTGLGNRPLREIAGMLIILIGLAYAGVNLASRSGAPDVHAIHRQD